MQIIEDLDSKRRITTILKNMQKRRVKISDLDTKNWGCLFNCPKHADDISLSLALVTTRAA
jgi:hypothetical protein